MLIVIQRVKLKCSKKKNAWSEITTEWLEEFGLFINIVHTKRVQNKYK